MAKAFIFKGFRLFLSKTAIESRVKITAWIFTQAFIFYKTKNIELRL